MKIYYFADTKKKFSFFRALSTKIAIDQQARLIHRDTAKIVLPYEHWTNACFLKHCSGKKKLYAN